jgi:NTP pyrophosphatase (non-canonical NTP hydrolase)
MTLNQLADQAHANALTKGFYESAEKILDACTPYGPEVYDAAHNAIVAEKLALIHSEVSEAIEALRKDHRFYIRRRRSLTADHAATLEAAAEVDDQAFASYYKNHVKDQLGAELAGSMIRLLDLASFLDVDIQTHVEWEMRFNTTRARKHEKAF